LASAGAVWHWLLSQFLLAPGIWFGFKGLGTPKSLILNVASINHDADEVEKINQWDVNYDWI
jgi:hypothetical protein